MNAKHKKGTGLRRKYSVAEVQSKVKAVQFRCRQSFRTLAKHTGIPMSTFSRLLRAGALIKSRNSIKHILIDVNNKARVDYDRSFVGLDGN